jgi:hypothetical protein
VNGSSAGLVGRVGLVLVATTVGERTGVLLVADDV